MNNWREEQWPKISPDNQSVRDEMHENTILKIRNGIYIIRKTSQLIFFLIVPILCILFTYDFRTQKYYVVAKLVSIFILGLFFYLDIAQRDYFTIRSKILTNKAMLFWLNNEFTIILSLVPFIMILLGLIFLIAFHDFTAMGYVFSLSYLMSIYSLYLLRYIDFASDGSPLRWPIYVFAFAELFLLATDLPILYTHILHIMYFFTVGNKRIPKPTGSQ